MRNLTFKTPATDEHLPALPTIMDAAAMQKILARHLDGAIPAQWEFRGVAIKEFDHRPGRKCEIMYGLYFQDRKTEKLHRHYLFALALPQIMAEERYAKALQEPHGRAYLGPALFFIPELGMILWGFPNDPRLKGLHQLIDTASLQKLLRAHWARFNVPANWNLAEIETEVIKYVPRDRCTLMHRLLLQENGRRDELVIFSKTYSFKTAGEPVYQVLDALWQAPVCRSGALQVPEPLFFEPEINAVFQRGLPGPHAIDQLDQLDLDELAAKCGTALAGIHQSDLPLSGSRSRESELEDFAEGLRALVKFEASYEARLQAVQEELWRSLPQLPAMPRVPIHGAFRLSQLLMVNGEIALLDFDGFLRGDPVSDVSSFVAHLLYLVVKGEVSLARSHSAIRRFCRAYAQAAPWGLSPELLDWYAAVMLVGKQAKKCIHQAKRNYGVKAEQLVNMARDILAGKERLI